MSVPPPTTFAEGQRKLYGIAAASAGVCFGLAVLLGGYFVLFGTWTPAQETARLRIIAGLLFAGCLNTTVVIVGLLLGGPVGKFGGKVSAGQNSAEINAEASDK